ncbi:MAG: hypothetical protein LBT08_05585 [Synergistaceae bacterium]|nr:hypothetical protein [Synergistaceae bacterium]
MTQSAPGQDLSAEAALQALQAEIDNEIVDIGETESDVTGISRASTMVMQTALLAEVSGRYPVAPASVLAPPPPPTSISLPSVEVIEPDPPEVTVIAIMITDSDKVAMVDVLGEVGGLIVRQGSSFAGGTAKVTKIDAKGVTFIWMKKSYTITVQ